MNPKVEFLDRTKKKKLVEELNKIYGIEEIPHLVLRTGAEKLRIYSGNLSIEEMNMLAKNVNLQLIGTPLCTIKEGDIRLNFDTINIPEIKKQITKNIVEINDEELGKWLRGDNIERKEELLEIEGKFMIIKNKEDYIGTAYNGKTFLKNYIPKEKEELKEINMEKQQIENFRKAGEIVKQVKEYSRTIVKKDAHLLELAEKIEKKIIELRGKPAFPVTFGINEFTAHVTPTHDDTSKAHGLIKVDFGVAVNGCAADNAFTVDLENNDENKKLIKTSDEALEAAINAAKSKKTIGEIGDNVQKVAEKNKFSPIRNLSGHSISEESLHAGITIPNFNNNNQHILEDGVYAIEPFITNGIGEVFDAKPSGIYEIRSPKNIRDSNARKMLDYIAEEYGNLPFCSRWLVKEFGTRALISLRLMEQAGIIYQFDQLVEKSRSKVSQSEATILVNKGNIEILTQ